MKTLITFRPIVVSLLALCLSSQTMMMAQIFSFRDANPVSTEVLAGYGLWTAGGAAGFSWNSTAGAESEVEVKGAVYTDGANSAGATFTSPLMATTASGITVTVKHWYDFENGLDGGILNYQVNNGTWTRVDFGQDGNKTGKYFNSIDALAGKVGWTAESKDFDLPAFVTSTVTLSGLAVGAEVKFQFEAGWDDSYLSNIDGRNPDIHAWVIKEVSFSNLAPVPEPSAFGLAMGLGLVGWSLFRRTRG